MKKLCFVVFSSLCALFLQAEGYQVNTFSAKQTGMGHVGVAMKLGAESNIFNPAALSFSEKVLDVSAGMSAIKADASAFVDGAEYKTSNKVSTPFNISASSHLRQSVGRGVTLHALRQLDRLGRQLARCRA